MARIDYKFIPRKPPSMKGLIVVSTWRGRPYIASWPRKRSRPLHPVVKALSDRFAKRGLMIRYATPQEQLAAIEGAKGTPFYPRDVLTMFNAGTLGYIKAPNGARLYSMATRVAVSESLDVLSQIDGTILARQNGLWVPVEPSAPDQLLISNATGEPPSYVSPGSRSGGHGYSAFVPTAERSTNEAAKGFFFIPMTPMTIDAMLPRYTQVSGKSYKCELWSWDRTKLLEKLDESPVMVATFSGVARRPFTMQTRPALTAGYDYVTLFVRTSDTGTTSNHLFYQNTTGSLGLPIYDYMGFVAFASVAPAVNDTPAEKTFFEPGNIDLLYRA